MERGEFNALGRSWLRALPYILTSAKTASLLTAGAVYGRLALPAVYDDVTYHLWALDYLEAYRSGGALC